MELDTLNDVKNCILCTVKQYYGRIKQAKILDPHSVRRFEWVTIDFSIITPQTRSGHVKVL